MTKKGVSHQIGFVKAAVITACLVASILGARLAAVDDTLAGRVTMTDAAIANQNSSSRLLDFSGVVSPSMMPPVAHSQSSK